MKIFLMGMPAAGKTTLGKILARHLHYSFIDLDEKIEEKENQSISGIFSEKGESYFREIENKVLQEIIQSKDNYIIATGGGTPCFHNNLDLILSNGISLFLNTPLEKIYERIKQTNQKRPLFKEINSSFDLKKKVDQLYKKRLPHYSKASHTISTIETPMEELVNYLFNKKN